MPVLLMNARLTDSERNALEKAVSKKFIKECGWEEGSHGQIKQGTRTLFDVGFTTAIRKVLAGGSPTEAQLLAPDIFSRVPKASSVRPMRSDAVTPRPPAIRNINPSDGCRSPRSSLP